MRVLLLALTLAQFLAGCVSLIDLPPGLPAEGRIVREVEIENGKKVPEEAITEGLEMHPPEGMVRIKYNVFNRDAVSTDRLRIESYYQKHGYFSARVTDVRIVEVRDRYMDVIYTVDEGKPTIVRNLGVSGIPATPMGLSARVLKELGLDIGDRYTEEKYLAAKQRIGEIMREEGYAFADLSGQVLIDKGQREAAARFSVIAGERVKLGKPTISGLEYFPAETVAKRVAWKQGELYDPALIKKTRTDILALQRFGNVRIGLDEEEGSLVDPILTIRESQRNELRAGGGMAADPAVWRVRLRGGYTRRGFLGPLNTLTIDLRPAWAIPPLGADSREDSVEGFVGEALAAIERIDFPADFFSSSVQVGYQVDEVEAFSTRGPQLALETSRRIYNQRIRFSAGWGFRLDDFFQVRVADRDAVGIPDTQRVGFFKQKVSAEFRDQVLQPTRGFFAQVEIEEGTPFAGGEGSYVRIAPEGRGYYQPTDRLVLAARIASGTDLLGSDLPVTRRFFSGGASRHRGFPQRTLSPTALSSGTPPIELAVGGSSQFESNFELRFKVYDRYGLVLFSDGGDVTNELSGIDFANLHWAAGLGLRIQTPVGPVRVDIGRRLNRHGLGEPRPNDLTVFHLSLGEAF